MSIVRAIQLGIRNYFVLGGNYYQCVRSTRDGIVAERLLDGEQVSFLANAMLVVATWEEVDQWERKVMRNIADDVELRRQVIQFVGADDTSRMQFEIYESDPSEDPNAPNWGCIDLPEMHSRKRLIEWARRQAVRRGKNKRGDQLWLKEFVCDGTTNVVPFTV